MTDNKTVAAAIENFGKRPLGDVKVLMVEDDPFLSELVLQKLSLSGCVPYSVANGNEAIELARQFEPDVVILDLMLPGLSGEEILAIMKSDEILKSIPVIVFSNKSGEEDIKKVMDLGAASYL
jgi:DNA-binding response OmpR family regulator